MLNSPILNCPKLPKMQLDTILAQAWRSKSYGWMPPLLLVVVTEVWLANLMAATTKSWLCMKLPVRSLPVHFLTHLYMHSWHIYGGNLREYLDIHIKARREVILIWFVFPSDCMALNPCMSSRRLTLPALQLVHIEAFWLQHLSVQLHLAPSARRQWLGRFLMGESL